MRLIFPPTDSNAYWLGESLSTERRTVCASNPSGPRKLKSTVLDEVTVALVTMRNCRRYDWILARRALHSANGWLMCKVFCKSIGLRVYLHSNRAIGMPASLPRKKLSSDARTCPFHLHFCITPARSRP